MDIGAITLAQQTWLFLLSFLLGFAGGALYDVCRILQKSLLKQKVAIFFLDFFFMAVCALATFLFALVLNSGEIRAYILLGELLGFIVYYHSVGVLVMRASDWILKWMNRFFHRLWVVMIFPFRKIHAFCKRNLPNISRKNKKAQENE